MGEKKTPKTYSDGDIVELFARDRQKAFKALVGQYARPLYGYIRRMLVDHDDTDDVLQNTLNQSVGEHGFLETKCGFACLALPDRHPRNDGFPFGTGSAGNTYRWTEWTSPPLRRSNKRSKATTRLGHEPSRPSNPCRRYSKPSLR